ncbi:hypothetical protein M422DRAFT_245226 [Sphaerobolus stellatus SS14]|nr:hypothetical protein M422DRAFT_245226 [Sphaerobolus stellatus SS14]
MSYPSSSSSTQPRETPSQTLTGLSGVSARECSTRNSGLSPIAIGPQAKSLRFRYTLMPAAPTQSQTKPTIPRPTPMSANANANTLDSSSFTFDSPLQDTHPPNTKAGTVRSADDRTPLERKDPGKKLKILDLDNYLNEDVDLHPSPTRSKTKGKILLGANILSNISRKPRLGPIPKPNITTLLSDPSMSQSAGSQSAPAPEGDVTPLPQDVNEGPGNQHPQSSTPPPHPPLQDRLPSSVRSRFIAPAGGIWTTIYGQTLECILHPITPAHQRDWKTLEGNKFLAVISRFKDTRNAADRVAAMSALEQLLAAAFPGNIEIDVILGDTVQEHVHPNSAYPFLIQGLTDEETRILRNEFVLANETIATFFYPYDTILPITDYANDNRAAAELVRFLSSATEVTHFIAQHNDNIPFNEVPNPHNFVRWTLSTLRVTSSLAKRRNTGPVPIHNVFIHPPTTEPATYKLWISLLHGLSFDTRKKGTGKPTTAELCNVCKSVAHSEDTCAYAAITGWPAMPPSGQIIPARTNGGAYVRGRGHGGNFGRGQGSHGNPGWA